MLEKTSSLKGIQPDTLKHWVSATTAEKNDWRVPWEGDSKETVLVGTLPSLWKPRSVDILHGHSQGTWTAQLVPQLLTRPPLHSKGEQLSGLASLVKLGGYGSFLMKTVQEKLYPRLSCQMEDAEEFLSYESLCYKKGATYPLWPKLSVTQSLCLSRYQVRSVRARFFQSNTGVQI